MADARPGAGTATELERAALVVSIDTELAWGLVHRQDQRYRYDHERQHLARLLELLDRYRIPATWAIVGHLMLDRCAPVDGIKHPEIVRPEYSWFDGDWFEDDPCTSSQQAPLWYAPDLLELISDATVDHEIGSHGFSHIVAGDPGCSRACFDSELAAAVSAAASNGLTIESLVYPRNQIGHQDLLAEHGIRAYRGRRTATPAHPTGWQRVVDLTVGSERTVVLPIDELDRWNLPATIYFDVNSRVRFWRLWIRQVKRRLAESVARKSLFHVWFHPHDLRDNTETFFRAFERLCAAAAQHRDRGDLETVTMGQLAGQLESARR